MVFYTEDFAWYVVTGFYYNSKRRFRGEYTNAMHALSINLWRGRVWGIHKLTGRRHLLKTVWN